MCVYGTAFPFVFACCVLHRTFAPLADRQSPLTHMPHRKRIINYHCNVHVPQCVALFDNTFDSAAYEVVARWKGNRSFFLFPGNAFSWLLLFRSYWACVALKRYLCCGVMHEAQPLRTHEWWVNLRVWHEFNSDSMRCKFLRVGYCCSGCNRNRCCQYKHATLCCAMMKQKRNRNVCEILTNLLQIFMKYASPRSCGKCIAHREDKLTICRFWCKQFVQPARFHAVTHFCRNLYSLIA